MGPGKRSRKEEGRNSTETSAKSKNGNRSVPVVGVGASAGGLEAFTALFKALPPDLGMAFVNEEMQHRNELLTQLNNDLTNLLNSVGLPMVMLGADLSVRRFTPQAANSLGLMASDVGRPLPRLKLKIDAGNLEQTMLDVINEVQPRQLKLQDHDGTWRTLRITPYRTLDNRIDGVVLTLLSTDGSDNDPAPRQKHRKP